MRSTIDLPEIAKHAPVESVAFARKLDRLALLFEGIFTVIGRVRTGRQRLQDPEDFRARMKKALGEVASTAARRGYASEDVQEATFAVVAFLDEAILTAPESSTSDWVGRSLGEEMFDQRSAGELFFKRLETFRTNRDSQEVAEVLEIYYLCLLLGFEGRYAGGSKGELLQIMANLRDRIERIIGRDSELSPDKALSDVPVKQEVEVDPFHRQLRRFALAAFLFALLCFFGFTLQLHLQANSIHDAVGERVGLGDRTGEQP